MNRKRESILDFTIFMRDKNIVFTNVFCKNCNSFQDFIGNSDLDTMYYVYKCVQKMTMSKEKIIVVKAPERSYLTLESLSLFLGENGIGWYLKEKKMITELVGEKSPKEMPVLYYTFERILKP